MKSIIILIIIAAFSLSLHAQHVGWMHYDFPCSFSSNPLVLDDYYLIEWQLPLLKGEVKSIVYEEVTPDSILVLTKMSNMHLTKKCFALEVQLNDVKQVKTVLIYNSEKTYQKEAKNSLIWTEYWTWKGDQLQAKSHWLDDKCERMVSYDYKESKIINEDWFFFSKQALEIYPFKVNYHYEKDSLYINGVRGVSFEEKGGILKYELAYYKNNLISRIVHNQDLKTGQKNKAEEKKQYGYEYTPKGELINMFFGQGERTQESFKIKYTDLDKKGNWQKQQFWKDSNLLFEVKRSITYNEKE
jgi:hypothetical protein